MEAAIFEGFVLLQNPRNFDFLVTLFPKCPWGANDLRSLGWQECCFFPDISRHETCLSREASCSQSERRLALWPPRQNNDFSWPKSEPTQLFWYCRRQHASTLRPRHSIDRTVSSDQPVSAWDMKDMLSSQVGKSEDENTLLKIARCGEWWHENPNRNKLITQSQQTSQGHLSYTHFKRGFWLLRMCLKRYWCQLHLISEDCSIIGFGLVSAYVFRLRCRRCLQEDQRLGEGLGGRIDVYLTENKRWCRCSVMLFFFHDKPWCLPAVRSLECIFESCPSHMDGLESHKVVTQGATKRLVFYSEKPEEETRWGGRGLSCEDLLKVSKSAFKIIQHRKRQLPGPDGPWPQI